jgi:cob(I)alamin adenosyltransferase
LTKNRPRKLGVEMIPLGDGCTWMANDSERDLAPACDGRRRCRQQIESGDNTIVVRDETTCG